MAGFGDLPQEIVLEILEKLPASDQAVFARVPKWTNNITTPWLYQQNNTTAPPQCGYLAELLVSYGARLDVWVRQFPPLQHALNMATTPRQHKNQLVQERITAVVTGMLEAKNPVDGSRILSHRILDVATRATLCRLEWEWAVDLTFLGDVLNILRLLRRSAGARVNPQLAHLDDDDEATSRNRDIPYWMREMAYEAVHNPAHQRPATLPAVLPWQ